jgi:c-di-GMP-binding flagellar brake protein YcgR
MNQAMTTRSQRRRARRAPAKSSSKVTCRRGTLGLGPNRAVAVLDLSETGIRLVVRDGLPRGQEVEIGLEGLNHTRPLRLPAQVVWSVATADGRYCIGAQFERRLSYADLHHLARF